MSMLSNPNWGPKSKSKKSTPPKSSSKLWVADARKTVQFMTWNLQDFGWKFTDAQKLKGEKGTTQAKVDKVAALAANKDLVIFQEITDQIGFKEGIDEKHDGLLTQLDGKGLNKYYPHNFLDPQGHNVMMAWKSAKLKEVADYADKKNGKAIDATNDFRDITMCEDVLKTTFKHRIIGKLFSFGPRIDIRPEILVIGAHLKEGPGADEQETRRLQLKCIRGIKEAYNRGNRVVIIGADFNNKGVQNLQLKQYSDGRLDQIYFSDTKYGMKSTAIPKVDAITPGWSDHNPLGVKFTITTQKKNKEVEKRQQQAALKRDEKKRQATLKRDEKEVKTALEHGQDIMGYNGLVIKNKKKKTTNGGTKSKGKKRKSKKKKKSPFDKDGNLFAKTEYDDVANYYDDLRDEYYVLDNQYYPNDLSYGSSYDSSNLYSTNLNYDDNQLKNLEYISGAIILFVLLLIVTICSICGCFAGYFIAKKSRHIKDECADQEHNI